MINFVTSDRVQVEISMPAAARVGLQLNSRLLSVATRVRKGELPLGRTHVFAASFPDARARLGAAPPAGAARLRGLTRTAEAIPLAVPAAVQRAAL